MGIHRLLERLGFVRLRDFGLMLTPERRVVTTHPTVLDDGYGGVVVGWTPGDPVAAELAPWGARPAAVPEPVAETHTLPIDEHAIVEHFDEAEPPEEDEWEWEIAVARARASSDHLPQMIDPVIDPPAQPVFAIPDTPPTDPSRPRTVIPVPTLPSGAVRTFEPMRYPRATNRQMSAVAPPRVSARR